MGSNLYIDVEYELSTQEKRTEIEGALSGAISFAMCKFSASKNVKYENQKTLQSQNIRISIKGSGLKKPESITNVGERPIYSYFEILFRLNN